MTKNIELIIISIVAIVAIVGFVSMNDIQSNNSNSANLGGYATKISLEPTIQNTMDDKEIKIDYSINNKEDFWFVLNNMNSVEFLENEYTEEEVVKFINWGVDQKFAKVENTDCNSGKATSESHLDFSINSDIEPFRPWRWKIMSWNIRTCSCIEDGSSSGSGGYCQSLGGHSYCQHFQCNQCKSGWVFPW